MKSLHILFIFTVLVSLQFARAAQSPIANAGTDKTVCISQSIQLGVPPEQGNLYSWQPITGLDNPTKSNPIFSSGEKKEVQYIVKVTNSIGESAYDTVVVTVVDYLNVKVSKDTAICSGSSVQLMASGGTEYLWNPVAGLDNPTIPNPIASPKSTTAYKVKVSNGSCIDSVFVVISVLPKYECIFSLRPSEIVISPEQEFLLELTIPTGVSEWKATMDYNKLFIKYKSIFQTTNGIKCSQTNQNGRLTLNGSGQNGTVSIAFNSLHPYNTDSVFSINLSVEPALSDPCVIVSAQGNTILLSKTTGMAYDQSKNNFLFNKENGVRFGISSLCSVRLGLYDYTGRLVKMLADRTYEAGEYSIEFDLPTGIYFCRIQAGIFNDIRKVTVTH